MKTKFQQWEDLIPEAITVNSEIISTQNEFQIAVVSGIKTECKYYKSEVITDIPELEAYFVFQKTLK